jgi:hypothetical protein
MTASHRQGLWTAGLIGLLLLFFSPALRQTFIFRDAFNLFYPYKVVVGEHLRRFSVCAWNPYETLGASFVGELSPGWFYPGNFLYLLFPPGLAFRLYIVGHFVLAGLFMSAWLRAWRLEPAAAVAGALAYTLSGYMLTQNGMPDMLTAGAWLPGSLWLLTLHLRGRKISLLLLFGTSLAMPLLAGRAEGVIISGLAGLGWFLVSDLAGAGLSSRVSNLVKIMLPAGFVALLVSMVQVVPSLELGQLSSKGQGLPLQEALLWSFHPKRLLEFFLPSPWGRFWPEETYRASELTGWKGYYPWALTQYLGLPILLSAGYALLRTSRKKRLLVSAMLLLAVLLSFGEHCFLYPLAYRLAPPFRIFRYPEKFMLLADLILCAVGARGIHLWLQASAQDERRKVRPGLLLIPAATLALAPAFKIFPLPPTATSFSDHLAGQVFHAAAVLSLFAALKLGSAFAAVRKRAGFLVVAIVYVDLSLSNAWLVPYASPGIYEEEPAALALMRHHAAVHGLDLFGPDGRPRPGSFRVMREPEPPDERVLLGVPGASRLERYRRWELATLKENFNFLFGFEALTGYTAAATADFDLLMSSHLDLKTMELFNTRYVIGPDRGSALERVGLPVAGERYDYGVKVFYLPRAFPRAYLIGRSVRRPRLMESLDLLTSHDFRSAVLLEDHPALPSLEGESELALTPVDVLSYSPGEVKIRTGAAEEAFLVRHEYL